MTITTPEPATKAMRIPIGGRIWLNADVSTPSGATGVVLFAHGSGSSRQSPRNRHVAHELNGRGMTTVLADLLTAEEEKIDDRSGAIRFDIGLLTHRLVQVVDWASSNDLLSTLPVGLFGASTGAAAALDAAALRPAVVRAVVSRGGRADLAGRLALVKAPTLLIVGANDRTVLDLNCKASRLLRCAKEVEIIPGATHLFEEPGALEALASAAGAWFQRYLG